MNDFCKICKFRHICKVADEKRHLCKCDVEEDELIFSRTWETIKNLQQKKGDM